MLPLYETPYSDIMPYRLCKLFKRKDVVHHETCPGCGRKLVNLYRRDKEWFCRLCWEAKDRGAKMDNASNALAEKKSCFGHYENFDNSWHCKGCVIQHECAEATKEETEGG